MDRRERAGELQVALRAAQQELAATLWTSLPGIINSYDPAKQTCTIKPAIKARVQDRVGNLTWVEMPLLVDCPVQFPAGGGLALTFPVQKGDEAIVIISDRCIDNWWAKGGVQEQPDLRLHDLSDGMAIVGISSLGRVMPGLSTAAATLRDTPGTTRVELTKTGNINIVAAGNININAGGAINLNATAININGVLTINGIPYLAHTHMNAGGKGNSGGVNA